MPGSMLFRSSSVDISLDQNSHRDIGVLEVIPDDAGAGNPVIRRRLPSTTSTQLNNNPDPETMVKGSDTGGRKRPNLAIRTVSPLLARNNTTSTVNTTAPKPRFDPMRAFRSSFLGKQEGGNNTSRSKGKEKEKADPEKSSLSVVDEARESRVAGKAREIREWMKGKSGSDIHRSFSATKTRQTVGGVRDLFKSRRPALQPQSEDRGPKAGQTYEIFEHRIIENSPERTVEISTWREQVPEKKNSEDQEDKISIYYISADEYPQEDRAMTKIEWRVDGSDVPPTGTDYSQTGSASRLRAHVQSNGHKGHISRSSTPRKSHHTRDAHLSASPTAKKANGVRESPRSSSRRHQSHSNIGSNIPGANQVASPLSINKEGSISPSTSEKESSSASAKKQKPPNHSSKFVENITSGSPSPPPKSPPWTQRNGHRRRYSTPVPKDIPPSPSPFPADSTSPASPPPSAVAAAPFNAVRDSGSTISTIKSLATVQFEAILQSCEPSLVHIAPVLRDLGIRRLEHLRAVGRLTPATRDREVKESALRLGVTVMEWAILLDKILTLL